MRCPYCYGNDNNIPCDYPDEGKKGCLRDKRLQLDEMVKTNQETGQYDMKESKYHVERNVSLYSSWEYPFCVMKGEKVIERVRTEQEANNHIKMLDKELG